MTGSPSVQMAHDLIDQGIRRLVFSAQQPAEDWAEAEVLLIEAGIEIAGTFRKID